MALKQLKGSLCPPMKPGKRDELLVKELRRRIDKILAACAAPDAAGAAAPAAGAGAPPVDGEGKGAASAAADAGTAVLAGDPPHVDGVDSGPYAAAGDHRMPPAILNAVEAPSQPPDAGAIVINDDEGSEVEVVCFLNAAGEPPAMLLFSSQYFQPSVWTLIKSLSSSTTTTAG